MELKERNNNIYVEVREEGKSLKEIAKKYRLSVSTIKYVLGICQEQMEKDQLFSILKDYRLYKALKNNNINDINELEMRMVNKSSFVTLRGLSETSFFIIKDKIREYKSIKKIRAIMFNINKDNILDEILSLRATSVNYSEQINDKEKIIINSTVFEDITCVNIVLYIEDNLYVYTFVINNKENNFKVINSSTGNNMNDDDKLFIVNKINKSNFCF